MISIFSELNFLVLKYLKQPGLEEAHDAFVKCLMISYGTVSMIKTVDSPSLAYSYVLFIYSYSSSYNLCEVVLISIQQMVCSI